MTDIIKPDILESFENYEPGSTPITDNFIASINEGAQSGETRDVAAANVKASFVAIASLELRLNALMKVLGVKEAPYEAVPDEDDLPSGGGFAPVFDPNDRP